MSRRQEANGPRSRSFEHERCELCQTWSSCPLPEDQPEPRSRRVLPKPRRKAHAPLQFRLDKSVRDHPEPSGRRPSCSQCADRPLKEPRWPMLPGGRRYPCSTRDPLRTRSDVRTRRPARAAFAARGHRRLGGPQQQAPNLVHLRVQPLQVGGQILRGRRAAAAEQVHGSDCGTARTGCAARRFLGPARRTQLRIRPATPGSPASRRVFSSIASAPSSSRACAMASSTDLAR